MNHSSPAARFFSIALAFISAVLAAPVQAAPANGKAVVVKVVGTASYAATKGGSGAVLRGMIFRQGTSIVTGPASSVVLDLGNNGETMVIRADTTLSLDTLDLAPAGTDKAATTQIELQRGSMAFSVKKLSTASKYEVRTPNGTAGIRGSEGVIYATGVFLCLDGTFLVSVRNLGTGVVETFTATAGNTVDASGPQVVLTPITQAVFDQRKAEIGTATKAVVDFRFPTGTTGASVGYQAIYPFFPTNSSTNALPKPGPNNYNRP